jgi:hypothetical protein
MFTVYTYKTSTLVLQYFYPNRRRIILLSLTIVTANILHNYAISSKNTKYFEVSCFKYSFVSYCDNRI